MSLLLLTAKRPICLLPTLIVSLIFRLPKRFGKTFLPNMDCPRQPIVGGCEEIFANCELQGHVRGKPTTERHEQKN
jgi:hypothetical protein